MRGLNLFVIFLLAEHDELIDAPALDLFGVSLREAADFVPLVGLERDEGRQWMMHNGSRSNVVGMDMR